MPEQFPYPEQGWSTGTMRKKSPFPSDIGEGAGALGGTSTIDTMMRLHQERMKAQGVPGKTADFEDLTPEEHKELMDTTPVLDETNPEWLKGTERSQQLDELLSRTQEQYDKMHQETGGTPSYTGRGTPIAAGRIRGTQEFLKDYLKNLPPNVSAHKMKDGTILLRTRSDLTS